MWIEEYIFSIFQNQFMAEKISKGEKYLQLVLEPDRAGSSWALRLMQNIVLSQLHLRWNPIATMNMKMEETSR